MKFKSRFVNRHEGFLFGLLGISSVLIVWQFFSNLNILNPIFLSSPVKVFKETLIFFQSGFIYSHLLVSLNEFVLGFISSIVIGILLGFVFGWYKKANYMAKPVIYAFYVTPIVAIFPLIIIWFGVGIFSKVMIIFIATVFPILINVAEAVRNIDPNLLRLAKSFKATDFKILTTIAFPYCFPSILSGIRIAMPRAIIGMVLSEFFLGNEGLGYLVSYFAATFQTARFLSVILILIFISILVNFFIDLVEKNIKFSKYKGIS